MELFSIRNTTVSPTQSPGAAIGSRNPNARPKQDVDRSEDMSSSYTFQDLGLCEWLCKSTEAVGYRHPTEIQKSCIPAILQGRDVLACAETGSGKTAAFVLPLLQILSQDPYGIFALILTPTRELAIQIAEQIAALGSAMSVTQTLIIGGLNIIDQSLQLSKRPHFIIATPGRLRHHLESCDPPNLGKAQFLVLDEADRLLSLGFSSELEVILSKMSPRRKTLLFSATLTNTLEELESLALCDALRFDLTTVRTMPSTLLQQYLFMPAKVKICFLLAVLAHYASDKHIEESKKSSRRGLVSDKAKEITKSIVIFVDTCHRCHEISEILKALDIDCVSLHSMLSQVGRLASLAKFKSMASTILVTTDLAGRGLDIPSVDMVINFDLPRICSDYVHRVGRTARAGRGGQSISFVTQYDVALLQAIENFTGQKMILYDEVKNEDIIPLLNVVSKAMQSVQLNILNSDFLEKEATLKKRKKRQRKQLLRKRQKSGDDDE